VLITRTYVMQCDQENDIICHPIPYRNNLGLSPINETTFMAPSLKLIMHMAILATFVAHGHENCISLVNFACSSESNCNALKA